MIVEALGHMTHLMAREKLEEQLPRILAGILGLYKKHPEPYHITQVLSFVMEKHTMCTALTCLVLIKSEVIDSYNKL